jgi:hypothetical protein
MVAIEASLMSWVNGHAASDVAAVHAETGSGTVLGSAGVADLLLVATGTRGSEHRVGHGAAPGLGCARRHAAGALRASRSGLGRGSAGRARRASVAAAWRLGGLHASEERE